MASVSIAEGLKDQLSALRDSLTKWLSVADSEGDSSRGIYAAGHAKSVQAQIDELEARRLDELGGGER